MEVEMHMFQYFVIFVSILYALDFYSFESIHTATFIRAICTHIDVEQSQGFTDDNSHK